MKKKYISLVFRVSHCNVILLSTEPISALYVFILRVQQCISFVAMIRITSFLQKTGAITIMLFVGTFSIIPCIQLNIFAIWNDAVFNDRMMHIATDSFRIAYVLFILHSHNVILLNGFYTSDILISIVTEILETQDQIYLFYTSSRIKIT